MCVFDSGIFVYLETIILIPKTIISTVTPKYSGSYNVFFCYFYSRVKAIFGISVVKIKCT